MERGDLLAANGGIFGPQGAAINAGAASVAYALAINPLIGAGTFLAQLFLREPLMRAFTFEYAITGPWSAPSVVKIDRKAEQAPGTSNSKGAEVIGRVE